MDRNELLSSLKESPNLEVLIVGGGINGIATFRDLAINGVKVLLIDSADFASGASAASSHKAHWGIRYLENGEFRLVREAVQERNWMIMNAPHIVQPLPTTIPIFKVFSGLLNAPSSFSISLIAHLSVEHWSSNLDCSCTMLSLGGKSLATTLFKF